MTDEQNSVLNPSRVQTIVAIAFLLQTVSDRMDFMCVPTITGHLWKLAVASCFMLVLWLPVGSMSSWILEVFW